MDCLNRQHQHLYIMRYLIGSQCSAISTGVMWSRRPCRIIKRILRHLEFVYQPLVNAKQHRVAVIQLWCYECMHDGLVCIDSQAMSCLGYIVQLDVSTLTHARNLGRHMPAATLRKHLCLVRFAGYRIYITVLLL